jgi:(R,R)-butanediol dehydrogenase/meso-butanediol dehydrogenase/diacetyl reductase
MKKAFLLDKMKIGVRNVSKPKPKPEEVLVKVHACSICGTDLHAYRYGGKILMNRVPEAFFTFTTKSMSSFYGAISDRGGGHQIAGEIVELGSDVRHWKIGDRVAGAGGSGFAEYCSMKRVYPLPDQLSYDEGAFTEPLAISIAAVRRSGLRLGDKVVVLGAGPIGQLTLQCAKAAGSIVYVTEIAEKRIRLARKFADEVLNPNNVDVVGRIRELLDGSVPNVIFECAGKDATMKQLIELAGKYWTPYGQQTRGVIVALYEAPWAYNLFDNNAIVGKNLELIGSLTYHPYQHPQDELMIALTLMTHGMIKIRPLITAKIPLDDINKGFMSLLKGEELGVVIRP